MSASVRMRAYVVCDSCGAERIAERIAAQHSKRPIRSVTKDAAAVRSIARDVRDVRVPIYDWQMTPEEFEASMRDCKVQNPDLAAYVLDYVQLMRRGDGRNALKEHEFMADLMPMCKRLAQDLNVVGIVLAQLTREARKGDGPPGMSAFRGGGAIEDNADKAGILWRDVDDSLKMHVCKNRQGPKGNVAPLRRRHDDLLQSRQRPRRAATPATRRDETRRPDSL